jgi:16S rRNA (guanine527-N7)-methyltransferase
VHSGNIKELEKRFNDLVMEWNARINLVSRKKTNIYDLIEDCKLFLEYVDFRQGMNVMDLGTGGGIPGIVIKIHYPGIQLTLVDSIGKKIKAVDDIVNKLGLENTEVICSRAEDMAKQDKYRNKFDYIVARSVAALDELAKWSKDLIKPGGSLVTVKGEEIMEEMKRTKLLKYVENIEVAVKEERKIVSVNFIKVYNAGKNRTKKEAHTENY